MGATSSWVSRLNGYPFDDLVDKLGYTDLVEKIGVYLYEHDFIEIMCPGLPRNEYHPEVVALITVCWLSDIDERRKLAETSNCETIMDLLTADGAEEAQLHIPDTAELEVLLFLIFKSFFREACRHADSSAFGIVAEDISEAFKEFNESRPSAPAQSAGR